MSDQEITRHHKSEPDNGVEGTREGPTYSPAVDIFETEDLLTLTADIPGVAADSVDIDLDDDMLTITAETTENTLSGDRVLLNEYRTGRYYRKFRIGKMIDKKNITAAINDGVLELILPKADPAKPRKIQVSVG